METGINVSEINKNGPLISVIVPIYNIEQELPACLDSICSQTYRNLEIILVDDGSGDRSGSIADEYAQKDPLRVKVIHQENQGVAAARLNGLSTASGEWIGFVDGDDCIEPDMYSRLLVNGLFYQADISHCGYQSVVNGGERIHYFYNTGDRLIQEGNKGLRDLLEGHFIEPSLGNKLYHRSLFKHLLAKYDCSQQIRINEDLLMNYYLFKVSRRAVYEDFCLYHYIVRSSSATRSGFRAYKVLDPVKVWSIILKDVDSELKDIAWGKYLSACRNAYAVLQGKDVYKNKSKALRKGLLRNRDKWYLLSGKSRIRLSLLLLAPALHNILYHFYERYLQKTIYE